MCKGGRNRLLGLTEGLHFILCLPGENLKMDFKIIITLYNKY